MNTKPKKTNSGISRRGTLRLSGLALAGLVLTGLVAEGATSKYGGGDPNAALTNFYPTHYDTQRYTYFEQLPKFDPRTPLETDEMRISFMGSAIPMPRRAQKEMSIFVEVGWDTTNNVPLDQFIFDFGCGVCANYQAMGVGYGRMDKIFINHLHGDHVNDLIHVYCFGNGGDRKSPLYVWGHGPSDVPNPGNNPPVLNGTVPTLNYSTTPAYYDDGTWAFCDNLREALRWHTESQAFQSSARKNYPSAEEIKASWGLPVLPVPVGDDPFGDANALIPIELDWRQVGGVAYNNQNTGAKVTHYPVVHCRQGSMGYKLEWTPPGAAKPLSMIYSSDTKPETNSVNQAINGGKGVDVFIHEMIVPAEVWAMKNQGLSQPGTGNVWNATVQAMIDVQNSSHTPQGAFGYMLSQIKPRPRLTVATHFPVADDTVASALKSVQARCPDIKKVGEQLVWSFDLMVLRVFPDKILQRRAVVNDYSFNPPSGKLTPTYPPKYHTTNGTWDAFGQIDQSAVIAPTNSDGTVNYRSDGW